MLKKLAATVLAFVLLTSLIPNANLQAQQTGGTFANPLIWADVPDPDIIRVGDVYYMSSTTMHMNPGVPIMKSYDLVHWEIVNYVYDMLADNDKQALRNGESNYGQGSWASSLRYYGGKFYLAFASYDTGKTYIYQTADIENGPWTYSTLDGVYHDMSLLFDEGDGNDELRVYMVYGGGDIRIIELTSDATAIKPGGMDKIIIHDASAVAGGVVGLKAEGAHIHKINGYYYIFTITWPQNEMRTQLVHRAASIDGEYEGRVALRDAGVAQGGIIDTVDGEWFGLLFGDRGAVGRIPYLVPVTWEQNWPVFGIDGKVPQSMDIPVSGVPTKSFWVDSDEFYQGTERVGASRTVFEESPASAQTQASPVDAQTFTVASAEPESVELIVNGGFESDSVEPWTAHDGATLAVTNEDKYSGNSSLLVSGRSVTGSGPQQSLAGKLRAGGVYEFSAKVKYAGDDSYPASKTFNLAYQDGNWETIQIMTSSIIAKGEWGTIAGTFTIPDNTTPNEPIIFIETPWAQTPDSATDLMDFYVDDVTFVDVSPQSEEEDPSNLLRNGGFESGLDHWSTHDEVTLEVTDEDKYSGSYSLLVSERVTTGSGPQQSLEGIVKAGHVYSISAKIKYTNPESPAAKTFQIASNGITENIEIVAGGTVERGAWGTVEGTFTIPADATLNNPLIFFETTWTANPNSDSDLMDFYVDSVKLIDVTPDSNLIENGGFEKGLTSWTSNNNAILAVTDETVYSGEKSMAVSGRTTTGSGPRQSLAGKVKAGHVYSISAKIKYTNEASPAEKRFQIASNGIGGKIEIVAGGTVQRGEWGTVEGTFTIPDDAVISNPFIFFETTWTGNPDPDIDLMNFYVDEVIMKDVTPSGGKDRMQLGEYDYNGSNLKLVWQWNHNPDNRNWSLTERPGYLRLTTGRKSTNLLDARNTLSQRMFGPESSATVAVEVSGMKNGDYAGLAALQAKYGQVGVKMSDNAKSIVMIDGSAELPVEAASIPLTQDRVYFKVEADFKSSADKAYFYYSLDGVNWKRIGNTLQMQYTLPHFMGYRFALYNYATLTTGGHVDFDYYRIDDKLTRDTASATLLQAELGNAEDIVGAPNVELDMPIRLESLPEGDYEAITASFNIPKELEVSDVEFNNDGYIEGNATYSYDGTRLMLYVSGERVNFTHESASTDLFATIKLKVKGFAPMDRTVSIRTDYIQVEGGNVVYNVHGAVGSIPLKKLDTGALAKVPGYSNPLISHKYGADPFALVYKDRVYIYMTSDAYEYDDAGNVKSNTYGKINTITVISSADMVNWTDHGEIPVAGPNGAAKWANLSWAPAAAYKKINGQDKFFLYFSNATGGIGVLTADSPIGPWSDPIGKPVVSNQTPGTQGVVWMFDPAVLVDDDGTGYLYFGGGVPGDEHPTDEQVEHPMTARVIQLADNMVETVGEAATIDAPYMFENSGIHKYNGQYYYTYCTNFAGDYSKRSLPAGEIAYMVSDNPMGPFELAGPLLKNPYHFFQVGGNNHHAIFEFNHEWYITYHAQTLGKVKYGDGMGYRSTHINKVEFYENGLMKEIQADMEGVAAIATLKPYERTEAETIAWNAGIATVQSDAPGQGDRPVNLHVTDIQHGDWTAVANVDFGVKGAATFEAYIASIAGGVIEIRVDSPIGPIIGALNVAPTQSGRGWELLTMEVERVEGIHNVFFLFKSADQTLQHGGDGSLFDIDYWRFAAVEPEPEVIPVQSVHITNTSASLKVGDRLVVSAGHEPANATNPVYQWSASGGIVIEGNRDASAVEIRGAVVGTGKLTLTVTAGGVERTAEVTINVTSDGGGTQPTGPTPTPTATPAPTVTLIPSPVATPKPTERPTASKFTDMKGYSWAEEAVNELAKQGIVNGTSENSYNPGRNITRADFVTLLVRALGLKTEISDNFKDVAPEAYYYEALGVAKQLGIATGIGENAFNPRGEISRQDMMVLVARALQIAGRAQLKGNISDLNNFTDKSDIADYAIEAVAALVKEGIIVGSGNGRINPKGTATRAEVAVIVYRILNKYSEEQAEV